MWFFEFLGTFFAAIVFDFVFYSIPVLIYRFWIRKGKPVESKWKATWVGWIFWICSFTAMCLFYLIVGFYNEEGFSVRPGLLDIAFMALGSFILYYRKKESKTQFPAKHDTCGIAHETICKCSKCGSPVQKNAKFCTECGSQVFFPIPDEMIICPICRSSVRKSNFCTECGHPFEISKFPSVSNEPQEDHQALQPIEDVPQVETEASVPDSGLSKVEKIMLLIALFIFVVLLVLLFGSIIIESFVF